MGKKKKKRAKKSECQNRVIESPKTRLVLPNTKLIRPMSPYERRMLEYACPVPSLGTPEAARLQKLMEMDVEFQLKIKNAEKQIPFLEYAKVLGGSDLPLSKLLRWYFIEYLNRFVNHGPESFPTSFNVVESFMKFNREYMYFDLRDEVEHLLSINDYFRWYDSGDIPREPQILESVLPEGTIYSYDMVSNATGLRICGESEQVIAGVSFIRHAHELSCILLAGENPPLHSDEEIQKILQQVTKTSGRENIEAAPELTIGDRYLDGYPNFAKIIVLTRFDLRAGKHDVRYVCLDSGRSFQVLTDDASVFEDVPSSEVDGYQRHAIDGLKRYDDLFAAISAMIYLPAFFAVHPDETVELKVATKLHVMRETKDVRETIKKVGESQNIAHRSIHCLPVTIGLAEESQRTINPPDLQFQCDGYWKSIGPLEIGEDKDGNPVMGQTWVSRHESWSARSPQSFLLRQAKKVIEGPDPGVIYIQRSPSHEVDLYKIGLTRRNVELRASELSASTGVPLPFGVLASWDVGDCSLIEREVHQRLADFRINPNREFFHLELPEICQTINDVINSAENGMRKAGS